VSVVASRRNAGFTLSELFVGLLLSSIVMAAVLSSYVYVARSYVRTVGFGLPGEPTLETQGRHTLAHFVRDVPVTSAITSPSASEVTLAVPHPSGGTKDVTYYYNSTDAAVSVYGVSVPANSLVRIDRATSTLRKLHSSLQTCVFTYYDNSGQPYTAFSDYAIGIKQISLSLTAQGTNAANQTVTQLYRVTSPRLVLRNKPLLP
jgi:hypothetical protein